MADIYKIGVSIAMKDNASQVLGVLAKRVLGLNVATDTLATKFDKVRVAMLGMAGVAVGGAALSGMVKLVDAGKEFVHQQSLMYQAGLSHAEVAQAVSASWRTASEVIGSSAEKNIALVADLRNQLGSMQEAIRVMPQMARMGVVLSNLTGQDQERAAFTGIRFLDQRGSLVDPRTHEISGEHLTQQARLLEAIAVGTRGRAGPDQLLAFQQYARLSGAALSDQGLMNLAPVIAASGSPSSVGTQLSSLTQQLLGGVMTKAGADWMEQLGLMDPNKVHVGRGGHLTLDRGALRASEQMQADPVSWVRDNLLPALVTHGFTTTESQNAELLRSHLRGTVVGLLGEIVRNLPAFQRDAENIQRAGGADQYAVAQSTDPTTKLNNFTTAWHNLLTALGAPMVNDATGMLSKLTGGISKLTDFARHHPRMVQDIELTAGALAALAAVSGTVALTALALGPLVTGISALGAAVTGASVAAVPAMAAFGAGLAALVGVISVAGGALYAGNKLENWALKEDHKLGYDDGSPLTWKDKLDPFQWFHHHQSMREINEGKKALHEYFDGGGWGSRSPVQHPNSLSSAPTPHITITPAPVILNGKQVGQAMFDVQYRQAQQELRSTSSHADGLAWPQLPGAAWGGN